MQAAMMIVFDSILEGRSVNRNIHLTFGCPLDPDNKIDGIIYSKTTVSIY